MALCYVRYHCPFANLCCICCCICCVYCGCFARVTNFYFLLLSTLFFLHYNAFYHQPVFFTCASRFCRVSPACLFIGFFFIFFGFPCSVTRQQFWWLLLGWVLFLGWSSREGLLCGGSLC
ncbi:hypothetical protein BX070DRAFT_21038 [Coemansia spiralis]|nr:hypothetical protein BX070DRAFT_21038 [Coemansia spiralis]